jgi:hypothetical protein
MPRHRLNPTAEDRKRVKQLAAVGTSHENIARLIGIRSPKTLRLYFREELDRGVVEANAAIAGALFNKASNGDVPAQRFWLINRADWHPEARYAPGTNQPPPFIVAQAPGGEKK